MVGFLKTHTAIKRAISMRPSQAKSVSFYIVMMAGDHSQLLLSSAIFHAVYRSEVV